MFLDLSIPVEREDDSCHVTATAQDVIQASFGARLLNALSLPLHQPRRHIDDIIASDNVAYSRLSYLNVIRLPFPIMDVRWGIAGTAGTFSQWHVDGCGFGTVIDVETGHKLWIVAHPCQGHFADLAQCLKDEYDPMAPNEGHFFIEAIILRPGDRL